MNNISSLDFARFVSQTKLNVRKFQQILKMNIRSCHLGLPLEYEHQDASDLIRSMLVDSKPCMISWLGAVELRTLVCYLNIQREPKFPFEKQISYVMRQTPEFWWSDLCKLSMSKNAGFFPPTNEYLDKFARLMNKDIRNIDILGSWRKEEIVIKDILKNATVVGLTDLRPWKHPNPWSEVLEDKIVLVIHPFDVSIQNQYSKRDKLFKDKRVLPKFELKTLRAVQSFAGNKTKFDNWFDALYSMCEEVSNIQFDVAIIGAGAYGLSLASFVKEMGKKSVHLGGVTQLLFGIKGKRWEEQNYLQKLCNDYWVRPLPSETPEDYQLVEQGCYW